MPLITDHQELINLRTELELTQAKMAEIIGMPFRTYQALEGGQNPVKPWHLKAAKYAAIEYATAQSDIGLLPVNIWNDIRSASLLIDQSMRPTGK